MSISPAQCRMARAGLNWSQTDLSHRSGVAPATIAGFERGSRTSYPRTIRDLKAAFEAAGVGFEKGSVHVLKDDDNE